MLMLTLKNKNLLNLFQTKPTASYGVAQSRHTKSKAAGYGVLTLMLTLCGGSAPHVMKP
jgi:hypothetical protein